MAVVVDKTKGKGSHARLKYGARVTTVPRHIGPGLRRAILKQLGIDPTEFDAM
jgi:predicted RNA binding protein YcfA (HicA-like mRNA interferase family)